jgi:hypothetical protein
VPHAHFSQHATLHISNTRIAWISPGIVIIVIIIMYVLLLLLVSSGGW